MKNKKALEVLDMIEDETKFSLSNFIPPFVVLQAYFIDNLTAGERSFKFDEALYGEVTDLLLAGEIGRRFEQVAVPAYVDTPLKWEAWVCNKKYAVPYDDYLKLIETENDALLKLNVALEQGYDDVTALHLAYLDAAQLTIGFFNQHRAQSG